MAAANLGMEVVEATEGLETEGGLDWLTVAGLDLHLAADSD